MKVKDLKNILAGCPDDCEVVIEITEFHIDDMSPVMDVDVTFATTLLDGDEAYVSRIILSDRMRSFEDGSWAEIRKQSILRGEG